MKVWFGVRVVPSQNSTVGSEPTQRNRLTAQCSPVCGRESVVQGMRIAELLFDPLDMRRRRHVANETPIVSRFSGVQ